jgi:hypothetical protein
MIQQEMLKKELLDIEINLQDALITSRKMFTGKIATIIEDMKEYIRIYINNDILVEIELFTTKFMEAAAQEMDRFYAFVENPENADEDPEKEFEPPLIELCAVSTKEEITTTLQSFKESLANKIAGYETMINSLITKDWKSTEEQLIAN